MPGRAPSVPRPATPRWPALRAGVGTALLAASLLLAASPALAQPTPTPTPPPAGTTSAPTSPPVTTTPADPPTAGEGTPADGSPTTTEAPADPATPAPEPPALPAEPAVTPADAAAVGEISRRLAELDASTTTLLDEIAGAQDTLDARRAEVVTAAAAADRATATAREARTDAEDSRTRVDRLVAATYDGTRTSRLSAVLVATGPQDLLDRMTGLTLVSEEAGRSLSDAQVAVAAAEASEAVAQQALDAASAAEAQARTAQDAVVERRTALVGQVTEISQLVARVQAGAAAGLLAGLDITAITSRLSLVTQVQDLQAGRRLVVLPTDGTFTSGYGSRWGAEHRGIDLANAIGTPVVAVEDGTVIDAGPASGFGQWVRLRHADGTITVYGHVDTYLVRVGQSVLAGQLIATMGNMGQSTGPHLHFEVIDPVGLHVDPVPWFAARGLVVR